MLTFLKSDHPLIIKQDNVRNLCADFFNANPLHYFTLVRCFHDGSFFPMGTHAQFILDWFDIFPIISVYHERYEHSQKYTFLWDEVMPEEGMDMAISKHGIYNGITIIYRYKAILILRPLPCQKKGLWRDRTIYHP